MSDKAVEWRPIETMPRTGEMVLMWSLEEGHGIGNWPHGCARGEWHKVDGEWRGSANRQVQAATHWEPLSEPLQALPNLGSIGGCQ